MAAMRRTIVLSAWGSPRNLPSHRPVAPQDLGHKRPASSSSGKRPADCAPRSLARITCNRTPLTWQTPPPTRSSPGEGACRARAAARIGPQLSIGPQQLPSQISRVRNEGFHDESAAGAPLGHLIGRQLVNPHALVLREAVGIGLDLGDLISAFWTFVKHDGGPPPWSTGGTRVPPRLLRR
jgi:hypothetical protein